MRNLIFIIGFLLPGVAAHADSYAEQAAKLNQLGMRYSASRGASSTELAASYMMQQNAFKAANDAAKKRESDSKKADAAKPATVSAAQSVPQPAQAPNFVAPAPQPETAASDQIAQISKILTETTDRAKSEPLSISATESGKSESEKSIIEKLADDRIKAIQQGEIDTLTAFVKQSTNLGLSIAGLASPNQKESTTNPQSRLLKALQEKNNPTATATPGAPNATASNANPNITQPQPQTQQQPQVSATHSGGTLTVNQIH